jgi:hypothetical protein
MTKFRPERCGRQIPVGTVVVRKMWTAGYDLVCGCWRDVGEKFELRRFFFDYSRRQVWIGRVVVVDL